MWIQCEKGGTTCVLQVVWKAQKYSHFVSDCNPYGAKDVVSMKVQVFVIVSMKVKVFVIVSMKVKVFVIVSMKVQMFVIVSMNVQVFVIVSMKVQVFVIGSRLKYRCFVLHCLSYQLPELQRN